MRLESTPSLRVFLLVCRAAPDKHRDVDGLFSWHRMKAQIATIVHQIFSVVRQKKNRADAVLSGDDIYDRSQRLIAVENRVIVGIVQVFLRGGIKERRFDGKPRIGFGVAVGVRPMASVHVNDNKELAGLVIWFLEGFVLRQADWVTCVSLADRERLIKNFRLHPGRVRVAPNGADLEKLRQAHDRTAEDDGRHKVLFFGVLNYPPNRIAVQFLAQEIAPEAPLNISFLVAGIGGEDLPGKYPNLTYLGFVQTSFQPASARSGHCFAALPEQSYVVKPPAPPGGVG